MGKDSYFINADKDKVNYLISKVKQAKRDFGVIYTYFLTPEEQLLLRTIAKDENVFVTFKGGNISYERAIAALTNMEEEDLLFPIEILKLKIKGSFEALTHRDYLGSVLALGIKREMLGDINIFEDGAELWLSKDISDFIFYNLNKIKHTGISSEIVTYEASREKIQKFKEQNINVSSLRIDCIVSSIIKASRNEASEIIKKGGVKLNYLPTLDISKRANPGDLLSIKGFGRYIFQDIINTTKSDRLVLAIKKYL